GRVERSARAEAAREAVGDGDGGGVRRRPDSALNPDSFFLTLGARCSAVRTRRAGPLNRGRARHALGYAVCFSLVWIIGRTDAQLGLNGDGSRGERLPDGIVRGRAPFARR